MTKSKKPYKPTAAPQSLTHEQEAQLLLQLTFVSDTRKQHLRMVRNLTMANVMLEAGLRVNELVQLRIGDLWFATAAVSTLVVRSEIAKGNRERKIPVSVRLALIIDQIHSDVWTAELCSPYSYAFFLKDPTIPLTTRSVERVIRQAAQAAFGLNVTPHMLRHTFATRVLAKSNMRIVQELLGHASITTTQRYCHPNGQQLADAINDSCIRR